MEKNREELIQEIDVLTIQVNKRFRQAMTGLFKDEITFTEYIYLRYLARRGPSRPSVLATAFEVSLAHVTSVCDRLVQKGYIYRQRTEEDRRTIEIGLSPEGQQIIDKFLQIKREFLITFYQDLTDEELLQFHELLEKINASFEQQKNEP